MRLRDKIKQADDLGRETVEVPEWGVTVEVRSMSGGERMRLLKETGALEGGEVDSEVLYPRLLTRSVFDPETDERVFADDDVEWLMDKNAGVLDRLATVAMRANGLTEGAADQAAKSFPAEAAAA